MDPALSSSDTIKRSAVLATFPWLTDFLLEKSQAVVRDQRFMPLFENLTQFESDLGQITLLEAADVRKLISVVDATTREIPTALVPPSKTAHVQLSQVLSLYKLVDVLHLLGGGASVREGRKPKYFRRATIGVISSVSWPMCDWIKTLHDGKKYVSSFFPPMSSCAGSTRPADLQVRLLRELHMLDTLHSGTKVLFNVQVAAIHLYYMLNGHRQNTLPSLPDFPQTVDQLIRSTAPSLEDGPLVFLNSLMQRFQPCQRRNPLHFALLISPLVLLVNKKLMSISLDQMKLANASKALGNLRPKALLDVEITMWKAVISVALGRASAHEAIQIFYSNVSWADIEGVSQADRDFFKPDDGRSTLESTLLSLDNEMAIDSCWLLADLRPSRSAIPTTSAWKSTAEETQEHDDPMGIDIPSETPPSTSAVPLVVGGSNDGPLWPPPPPGTDSNDMETPQQSPSSQIDVDSGMNVDDDHLRRPTSPIETSPEPSHPKEKKTNRPSRQNCKPKKRGRTTTPDPKPKKRAKVGSVKPQNVTPYQHIGSGSYLEPIDVDAYMVEREVTFEPKPDPQRVFGDEITAFTPRGDPVQWIPEFHFEKDLVGFQTFERLVRRSYTADGRPLHIAHPEQSSIAVLSNSEYEKMTVLEVQSLFREKHIVITDRPTANPPIQFDAPGLRNLTNLDSKINLQDQSIDAIDGYYPRQLVIGTLRQLLDVSRSRSGPILNALSFPLGLSGVHPSSFSTETEAWRVTEGLRFCPSEGPTQVHYPVSEMRWGLAATSGARHGVHIDADGLATFIDPKCGLKDWMLLTPPPKLGKHGFANIDTYLGDFDTSGVSQERWGPRGAEDEDQWGAEAICLTEGSRLIMRPNTPHMVFTTESSIVLGGHFYSMSNMQPTFFGIVHCFMGNSLVTNTDHGKTRILLIRMMQYVYKCLVDGVDKDEYTDGHIPNLLDMESMVDVLTLSNFCILANALDFRTYSFPKITDDQEPSPHEMDIRVQWDYNDVSVLDREHFTYVRGLARNFWTWIGSHYEISLAGSTLPVQDVEKDVCRRYLMDQACAMLNYKAQADFQNFQGLRFCKLEDLERQIDYVFGKDDTEWAARKANCANHTSLRIGMDFTVAERNPSATFIPNNPSLIGITLGDSLRKRGSDLGFPSTESAARPLVEENDEDEDEDEDEPVKEGEENDYDYKPSRRRKAHKA